MLQYIRAMIAARTSERGATAVEYGLLVAVIALLIIAGMFALSGSINGLFNEAGSQLNNPTT